jgi:predicted RNase H-like HicB family nuclease
MTKNIIGQSNPIEYYLDLKYPIECQPAEEGGFVVSIPALPGCITQVECWKDSYASIEQLRQDWIKAAYDDGVDIPLPRSMKEYSGKFVVRIPKSMHGELDKRAEQEGVSLNTFVISVFSNHLATPSEWVHGKKRTKDEGEEIPSTFKPWEQENIVKILYRGRIAEQKDYTRISTGPAITI